jgi:hypothetical protein
MYEVMQASWKAVAKPEGGKLGAGALCACAGVAGGLGGLVGNPVEVSHVPARMKENDLSILF